MINRVILVGRITKDPEIRYLQNGTATVSFTIACDRQYVAQNGERGADFINCVAFGRSAEFAEKYLKQGTKIVATGRIPTGSYTNKDGNKVYTTDVVIEDQEFAESKGSSSSDGGSYQPAGRPSPANASAEGFMSIPEGIEDDLPFK